MIPEMTPQEAIQEIKSKVYRNTDDCEMTISKDCYKAVLNALKKQIQEKPILRVDGTEVFECVKCKNIIPSAMPNCLHCGQALDWRGE